MNWIKLENTAQLDKINTESAQKPILIFKHSTRCPVSFAALDRLESGSSNIDSVNFEAYFLDLISFRNISNEIAERYNVAHQSPQLLIIKGGNVTYHNSHMGVSIQNINKALV